MCSLAQGNKGESFCIYVCRYGLTHRQCIEQSWRLNVIFPWKTYFKADRETSKGLPLHNSFYCYQISNWEEYQIKGEKNYLDFSDLKLRASTKEHGWWKIHIICEQFVWNFFPLCNAGNNDNHIRRHKGKEISIINALLWIDIKNNSTLEFLFIL